MSLLYFIYGSFKKQNRTEIWRAVPEKLSPATTCFCQYQITFCATSNFYFGHKIVFCAALNFLFWILFRMVCHFDILSLPFSNIKKFIFMRQKKLSSFFCASQIFYIQFLYCTLAAC